MNTGVEQREFRRAPSRWAPLVHFAVFRRLATRRPRRRPGRRPDAGGHRHSLANGDRPCLLTSRLRSVCLLSSPPLTGFALFGDSGSSRSAEISTIAPIFAGALGVLAATGPQHYAAAAAALSLAVGLILIFAGAFKFGFVADLLSIPVTTGFLIGIAGHILVLQAPAVLGVEPDDGPLAQAGPVLDRARFAANP